MTADDIRQAFAVLATPDLHGAAWLLGVSPQFLLLAMSRLGVRLRDVLRK